MNISVPDGRENEMEIKFCSCCGAPMEKKIPPEGCELLFIISKESKNDNR
jgi:hypothetical protein